LCCDGGKAITAFARRARQSQARGARPSHQQRQRLPRPSQGMDAAFPRGRHQEPPKLPELAANHRSPCHRLKPASLDHGRRWLGPLSTETDIRAKNFT
jgi:hypothetical protein